MADDDFRRSLMRMHQAVYGSRRVSVELLDEQFKIRSWTTWKIESEQGAWMGTSGTDHCPTEITFSELINAVSQRVRLGWFFGPKRTSQLERHVFAMSCYLEREGWKVVKASTYEVVLKRGFCTMTLNGEEDMGLMFALAIYQLFPFRT